MSNKSKKNNLLNRFFNKNIDEVNEENLTIENSLLQYCATFSKYQPNPSIIISSDYCIFSMNTNIFKEILGYEPKNIEDFKRILPEDTYLALKLTYNEALEGDIQKHLIDYEYNDQTLTLLLTFIPLKNQETTEGVNLIIEDLTEQQKSTHTFQQIFHHLNSGVWMKESISGDYTYLSKRMEGILELPLSRINNDRFVKMIHPGDLKLVNAKLNDLQRDEKIQLTYRVICANSKIKWLSEQIVTVRDSEGEIIQLFGLVEDVTKEKENEEIIHKLAYFDELTGLPNQRSLYKQLDSFCQSNAPFALMYLDLDRFNMINDSLGYDIGDEVLKIISTRLKSIIPNNAYIARLSSNDFVITLHNYSVVDEINQLADQIIQVIKKLITVEEYEIYMSTSIGITFYPEEGTDKLSLIENAHAALYLAKREGKGNYQLFTHSKDISSYKKYILDRDMRKAIINEDFELFFQPKVEPNRGQIYGAEVLMRWNHDEWGAISPNEFIPIAEENHLIIPITDWVIKKVITLLKEWKDSGFLLRSISVNVPPIRFMHNGLVDLVKEQLEMNQIPPKYLELEITESTLLKSEHMVLSTIEELKALGVRIAIDDFGKGYSFLDLLRRFKPDTVKIDRDFIRNLSHDSHMEKGIVSSILYLAKTLDMKVVAEGVEESEQLQFLKQQECDYIQGYLFSKAVTQQEYEKLMNRGFLKPQAVKKKNRKNEIEKRKYFRFVFPQHVIGKMTIIEVNNQKVEVGATPILLDNISIGGVKFLSNLKLPINSNMKFNFQFTLMSYPFEIEGILKWVAEEFGDLYSYGVSFSTNGILEGAIASIINRMSAIHNKNERIPDTDFHYYDSYYFFKNIE
ncbi:PAS domain S-box-containing protein/diguanylate cyclase (GGDEF)-like protein OS=Ureibacillus acetophenoni OX=614649 GN=SAMN05877842_104167 PE=4 SV=1 [Ureibacillus acetophenoni]